MKLHFLRLARALARAVRQLLAVTANLPGPTFTVKGDSSSGEEYFVSLHDGIWECFCSPGPHGAALQPKGAVCVRDYSS